MPTAWSYESAVAGDGDGAGGHGELLAKGCGNAAHLAALLPGGTAVLGLGEGFEGGERDAGGSGKGEQAFEQRTASKRAGRHRRGVFPLLSREDFALSL
jgi:hypothetical protein